MEGDPKTEYSKTGDVYRTAITSKVQVKRTAELLEDKPQTTSAYSHDWRKYANWTNTGANMRLGKKSMMLDLWKTPNLW